MDKHPDLQVLRDEIQAIDKEMAVLFEKRMHLAKGVIRCKLEKGLPVQDLDREVKLIEADLHYISDPEMKEYFVRFLHNVMELSKEYQRKLMQTVPADSTK